MAWRKSKREIQIQAERAFDLYWLGYLLTGSRELSVEAVIGSLDGSDAANPFFANWMDAWSRRIFLSKVLGSVRAEMHESAGRMRECEGGPESSADWGLASDTSKAGLERALLAIDLFPRCALLLTVFEKCSTEDAATLLNADQEMVAAGRAIGLGELARNLGQAQRMIPMRGVKARVRAMQELTA